MSATSQRGSAIPYLQNEIEGDQMHATQLAYDGKLLIFTLVTLVRCRLGTTLRLTVQDPQQFA